MRGVLLVLLLALGLAPWARGEELAQPVFPASKDVAFDPQGCHRPTLGAVAAAHLVATSGDRRIGPYLVRLDSLVNPELDQAQGYRPILIAADPGSTLRIDLENRLAHGKDDAQLAVTNLHTHGLIVSPTPFNEAHRCPGDSIFQTIEPTGASLRRYEIPIPKAALPPALFGLSGDKLDHPSGLYWFHAHLHGVARRQITSGMSGLISIGDPMTHLRVDRLIAGVSHEDETATRALRAQTDVVTMALRDIQIDADTCDNATHDCSVLPGGNAPTPIAARVVGADYDTKLCPGPGGNGFCARQMMADGQPGKPFQRIWLFTINGQIFPTITQKSGRNQLWRIANTSASVAYVLQIVGSDRDKPLPLCIVSVDGIVAGVAGTVARPCDDAATPSGQYGSVGVQLPRVLLMPGSRVEIYRPYLADRATTPRTLTLQTAGFDAGNADVDPQGNSTSAGDRWPAVSLANLAIEPSGPGQPAPTPLRANLVRGDASPPGTASRVPHPPASIPLTARDIATLQRVHPGCVFLPADRDRRRQIVFDEDETERGTSLFNPTAHYDKDSFVLGVRNVEGPLGAGEPAPGQGIPHFDLPPASYGTGAVEGAGAGMAHGHAMPDQAAHDAMDRLPTGPRVCAVLGRGEVWELVNWTSEVHNFHIHQGKFRLARAGDPGLPPGLATVIFGEAPTAAAPTRVMQFLLPFADASGDVQAWHDTIPVPPRIREAGGADKPGRVFVFIPFFAEEQVGSFVFHCHILEHEDKGMMANIEVVRPPRGGANRLTSR